MHIYSNTQKSKTRKKKQQHAGRWHNMLEVWSRLRHCSSNYWQPGPSIRRWCCWGDLLSVCMPVLPCLSISPTDLVEHMSRTFINVLSIYVDSKHKSWNVVLPYIIYTYNTTKLRPYWTHEQDFHKCAVHLCWLKTQKLGCSATLHHMCIQHRKAWNLPFYLLYACTCLGTILPFILDVDASVAKSLCHAQGACHLQPHSGLSTVLKDALRRPPPTRFFH